MKKRIVLVGAMYYHNLGDAALCYTAQRLLADSFDIKLLDIYGRTEFLPIPSVNTENCRNDYNHIVRRLRLRNIILHLGIIPYDKTKKKMFGAVEQQLEEEIECNKPVAIVFAGGAMFKGVFINSIVRIVKIAHNYNIPVVFNACGVDTTMFPVEWKRIGDVLQNKNVQYISIRDGYPFMRKKFPNIPIHETYDPAICANRFFKSSDNKKGIGLGIMLSHNIQFELQTAFWGRLIQRLNVEGRDWRMFTNGAPADQNYATYLLKINRENEQKLIPCPNTPEKLYYDISGFEGIISMRLHSHILAYSCGTPSVAISWDQKLDDFFAKIHKKENCLNFNASVDEIITSMDRSLNDPDFYRMKPEFERQADIGYKAFMNAIV